MKELHAAHVLLVLYNSALGDALALCMAGIPSMYQPTRPVARPFHQTYSAHNMASFNTKYAISQLNCYMKCVIMYLWGVPPPSEGSWFERTFRF